MAQFLHKLLVFATAFHLAVGCCWFDALTEDIAEQLAVTAGREWSGPDAQGSRGGLGGAMPEQRGESPSHQCVLAVLAGFGASPGQADVPEDPLPASGEAPLLRVRHAVWPVRCPAPDPLRLWGGVRLHLVERVLLV